MTDTDKRVEAAARAIVRAWDALSEGNYNSRQVEQWLVRRMKPAVDRVRSALAAADKVKEE